MFGAAALVCAALAFGGDLRSTAASCRGLGVIAPEPGPVPESVALVASAHMAATAVTRPPRPPRADLMSYFTST